MWFDEWSGASFDALSDAVLAAGCLLLAWRQSRHAVGVALGLLSIALAAIVGSFRFAGVAVAVGPHDFLSLLAAVAGLPLLAAALCWPNSLVARHARAAALFLIFGSALGLAMSLHSMLAWWSQAAPAVALLLLFAVAIRQRSSRIWFAVSLLLLAFLTTIFSTFLFSTLPFAVSAVQALHYLMLAGLLLLTWWPPERGRGSPNS